MAIFLRGDIWYFEYRTAHERVVKTTGFRKKDKAKAQAVLDAFRLARGQQPRRSVVEGILDAIYAERPSKGLALTSVWAVYEDWMKGKGKVISHKVLVERRGCLCRFVSWAVDERGLSVLPDVDVSVARQYIGIIRDSGRSNKTQRSVSQILSSIWEAVGQLHGGVHNPWKAAMPDKDGSEQRLDAFSPDEEARVLKAAKKIGHGWYLASVISRWTGLRYGDVARLDWGQIDLARGVIDATPSKTQKHGVRVLIPIAGPLLAALEAVEVRDGFVLPEHAMLYPGAWNPRFSFVRVLEAAGIDPNRFTFHSWRHTFRTRLAEAGVSEEVARRLGGWTNLKMAAHYDHATHLAEMRSAVDAMAGKG